MTAMAPKGTGKDLFSLALAQHRAQKQAEPRTVVVVGSKDAGKSTLLMRFLDRTQDSPKPTTALEYTYGRKGRGHDLGKDIVHLWELGGGTHLAKLVDTTVTAATIKNDNSRNLSFVLALDLSKPNDLWNTQNVLIRAIRSRVDQVLAELSQADSRVPASLKKKALGKYGDNHEDRDLLTPLAVPIVIMGTKYDKFQDFDPEKRKLVCKTLRFIAHTNGASLMFVSHKDEGLLNRSKALLNYLAFKSGGPSRSISVDHSKPLIVAVGSDSLAQIGTPPVPSDLTPTSARTPLALWEGAFASVFPPEATEQKALDDPGAKKAYAEASVDAVRKQKDDELERYRRQCLRKEQELAAKHAASRPQRASSGSRSKDRSERSRRHGRSSKRSDHS